MRGLNSLHASPLQTYEALLARVAAELGLAEDAEEEDVVAYIEHLVELNEMRQAVAEEEEQVAEAERYWERAELEAPELLARLGMTPTTRSPTRARAVSIRASRSRPRPTFQRARAEVHRTSAAIRAFLVANEEGRQVWS